MGGVRSSPSRWSGRVEKLWGRAFNELLDLQGDLESPGLES